MTHEEIRRKFWMDAYLACVSSLNCTEISTPRKWANRALMDFDEKFPDPLPEPIPPERKPTSRRNVIR
jgi:hypothetical protein